MVASPARADLPYAYRTATLTSTTQSVTFTNSLTGQGACAVQIVSNANGDTVNFAVTVDGTNYTPVNMADYAGGTAATNATTGTYHGDCSAVRQFKVSLASPTGDSSVALVIAAGQSSPSGSSGGGGGGGVTSIIADSPLLASTPTGDVELSLNEDMRDLGPPALAGANIYTDLPTGTQGCGAAGNSLTVLRTATPLRAFNMCINGDTLGLEVSHQSGAVNLALFQFSASALAASSSLCTTSDTIPAITTIGCGSSLPVLESGSNFLWLGAGTGLHNIGMGIGTLAVNTTGADNIAIGDGALAANTTNGQNVAVGYQALNSTSTSGNQNTAIGASALLNLTTNSSNVAVGYQSQMTSIDGGWNTSTGTNSLQNLNHGHGNACFGYLSCAALDINDEDVGIGAWALRDFTSTTQHSYNTAVGSHALDNGVTGSTGIQNTAVGYSAGQLITSGGSNVILGFMADVPVPTASNQMSLGNAIYCTGVNGTGLTISAASCGVGVQAPGHMWDVAGSAAYSTDGNNHLNSCLTRTGVPCVGFATCTNASPSATCNPGSQTVPTYSRCTATMATTASAAGGVLVIVDGIGNPGGGGTLSFQFEGAAVWTGTVSAYYNCVS